MRKKVKSFDIDIKIGDIMIDVFCINDKIETLGHTFIVGHPSDMPIKYVSKILDKCDSADKFIECFSDWKDNPGNNFAYMINTFDKQKPFICYEKDSEKKYAIAKINEYDIICSVTKNYIDIIRFDVVTGSKSKVYRRTFDDYKSLKNYIKLNDVKDYYSPEDVFELWAIWVKENYAELQKDPNIIVENLYLYS